MIKEPLSKWGWVRWLDVIYRKGKGQMKSSTGPWERLARLFSTISNTTDLLQGDALERWGGIPCFSNRWLQELEKLVISKTPIPRGPVSNAKHWFCNQSISRYVLIAYCAQRQFKKSLPKRTIQLHKLGWGWYTSSSLTSVGTGLSMTLEKMQILILEAWGSSLLLINWSADHTYSSQIAGNAAYPERGVGKSDFQQKPAPRPETSPSEQNACCGYKM